MADGELFLIDGNSLAYRAFFALPETIATSRGEPTNAIFGFASMLVKILTEHGPKATIVVWDAGMSGREQEYEPYKAERKPRPDLLREQWPHLEPLVEAFGYENVRVEGYEADDVIASLAEQAKQAGIPVMIVTGDRDAYQLAENSSVRIMTTSRGITDTRVYDREGVVERYGIPPELVTDFIGLKGDTSDNIPGVPGIGDKTAAQLLQQYGSLDNVLEHIDEISGDKRRQNLRENADLARISKSLATLHRGIDAGVDVGEIVGRAPDRSRLREVFNRFELRDPLRRLEEALGETEAAPRATGERRIEAVVRETLPAGIGELGDEAALVVMREGDTLRWAAHDGREQVLAGEAATLAELLEAWGPRGLVAHDWKTLRRDAGDGEAAGREVRLSNDTMVAAYLIDPARRRYPLDELLDQAGIEPVVEEGEEAARTAVGVHALSGDEQEEIDRLELRPLLEDIELPLVDVLYRLELQGVRLDTYRLGETAARVSEEIEELEHKIHELAGEEFTIGSPQQLSRILFEKLELSRKRRGKTGFSTDARVLRAIRAEHPLVEKVERWRELTKLRSTYLDELPALIDERTGRLHTTFNQTATTTGRLSSTNPNLQNIPIRTPLGQQIRSCFIAEEGARLISADYSQVELRILAHVAREEVLKSIFERGEDVHAATAAEVLKLEPGGIGPGERSRAKAVNFGIVYGLSAHGLSEQLSIPHEEAAEYIERYMSRFPAVQAFIDRTIAEATDRGYVQTLFGRRRQIPELRSRKWQTRSQGERLTVNTIIQGTAADIIKIAMVRCDAALREAGLGTRLVLTIHDELLFEGPLEEMEQATALVKHEMEGACELDPPLVVDVGVGENWLAAK
ncbi:MAG: DNA polymerase I [Solirubrobacterales bacterium]